jgi:beta-glucosidase/6-phospho-beta-glucosidase/beta-galactosidase
VGADLAFDERVSEHSFPDGFLWGVAGAGHQTEGDNTNSDTWFAELVTPKPSAGVYAAIAKANAVGR